MFQHTAARRRLLCKLDEAFITKLFQHTAARRRLFQTACKLQNVDSFNTQPPEGGCFRCLAIGYCLPVSTHSRPKAAGRPRLSKCSEKWFQHTAARRRLRDAEIAIEERQEVSTHSRPKAAAGESANGMSGYMFQHTAARRRLRIRHLSDSGRDCFNTQPPEGGCKQNCQHAVDLVFQHTAARRRLPTIAMIAKGKDVSTHSRPKAAAVKSK